MQTVNFNCSFCGRLMAVGMNLLGRNVRCPHCKQVLQAPSNVGPAPSPPSTPAFQGPAAPAPPLESAESIFGEVHDEDLFGTRPPKVLLPSGIRPPAQSKKTEQIKESPVVSPVRPTMSADPEAETGTMEQVPDFAPGANPWAASDPAPAESKFPSSRRHEENSQDDHVEERAPSTKYSSRRSVKEEESEGSGGGPLVWILLAYSMIATAAVAYLFFTRSNTPAEQQSNAGAGSGQPHPYTALPDLFGHYPPADRKKVSKVGGMPPADLPIPKELQVALGHQLSIGSLEVRPTKIEFRTVNRFRKSPGAKTFTPKETPGPILLLHLHLKNISDDVTFHPTDPAFDAEFPKDCGVAAYTGFIIGKNSYLGGPFLWPSSQFERQYVEGQEGDDKPLEPKEERDYVIASRLGASDIMKEIQSLKMDQSAVWRVQLRRGLVAWTDKEGKEHEDSGCCVIGVPFTASDVQQ